MSKRIDRTGQRFGKLVALRPGRTRKFGKGTWVCRCDCGSEKEYITGNLVSGNTKACDCVRYAETHGLTKDEIYFRWICMLRRCYSESHDSYPRYGGRGITVCDEWKDDIQAFHRDMKPTFFKGAQIDRIDNNKGYYKENCRWVTCEENQNNKRNNRVIEFNGEKRTAAQWARHIGVSQSVMKYRLDNWSVEKALTEPSVHSTT